MTRISWSVVGDRTFEAGIDRGVLYVDGDAGVPWIGLVAINHGQSGGAVKPRYQDGIKISNRAAPEQFEATIEAITYPLEFERCDGTYRGENGLRLTQQRRKPFGMSYRSQIGNDVAGLGLGYKLHILYNLKAEPSDHVYQTLSDQTDPIAFSWKVSSRAAQVIGYRPTAHFVIDSRDVPAELMQAVEDSLYGDEDGEATLLSPGELMFLFDSYTDLVYDAGSPYTPIFATYDAGTPATSVTDTIDGGAL
jgi:hypothetical protein